MIQPNEFRLGNLINACRGDIKIPMNTVFKILTMKFDHVQVCEYTQIPAQVDVWPEVKWYDISPIPLTEEWLIKFGFNEIDDDGAWSIGDKVFQLQNDYLDGEHKWVHIWDAAYTGARVNFVHQLQNLYFALTNTELTINPKGV